MLWNLKDIVNFITIESNLLQAFIKTAAKILQNIQEGVFDVSNEVNMNYFPCKKRWKLVGPHSNMA